MSTRTEPAAATLRVPGATLHYEIRGRGPMLLLLPGSGGDAVIFDAIADTLAARYTVVAIDPRGYSHSTIDSPAPVGQRVEVQADDAFHLIEHLTPAGDSASVFGGSGGAIVALELLVRHPERIARVIAHEPPLFELLPDAAEQRAFVAEVHQLFRTNGLVAASARFLEGIGGTLKPLPAPESVPPRTAAMLARLTANAPLMMEHELRQFTSHRPDLAALRRHTDRLVLGAGRDTSLHLPARPAYALAAELGIEVTEFPGGHSGFTDAPAEFADLLLHLLSTPRG